MGRGSRAIRRWQNDRQRKKKARDKRQAGSSPEKPKARRSRAAT
jgi:hypothetical protein